VKNLDFGLARGSIESDATGEASLTQSNVILGSVRYMSPEQARGDTLSVASDVFAAGILLYELTTGRHPFEGNSMIAVLQAVVEGSPLSPSVLNPAVSTALETLILEMLGKDPDGRPGANEIATRLRGMTPGAFPAATVPISPTPGAHIVGRASEREAIVAAWSAACAGRSSLIAIAGEPGIGKTTIVNDALGEIGQSGAPCLSGQGRCSESLALTEAYLPVLEALEGLLRAGADVAFTGGAPAPA
jgi:hypothetical protein